MKFLFSLRLLPLLLGSLLARTTLGSLLARTTPSHVAEGRRFSQLALKAKASMRVREEHHERGGKKTAPAIINVTENVTAARGPLNFTWSPPPAPMTKKEFKRIFSKMKHNRANSRRKRRNRTFRFAKDLARMREDDGVGASGGAGDEDPLELGKDTILWTGQENFHKQSLKLKSEYWTDLCNSTGVSKTHKHAKSYKEKELHWDEFCSYVIGVTILAYKDIPVASDAEGVLAWKSDTELSNTDLSSLVNETSKQLRHDVKLSLEVRIDDGTVYPTTFEYCAEKGDKGVLVSLPAPKGGWVPNVWETLVVDLPDSAYKNGATAPWKEMKRLVFHTNVKDLKADANKFFHFRNVKFAVI